MSGAYYNEIDPYAAQWLRNLIADDLIAPGEVDERSIVDVRPGDLADFTQCHFFAGIGGWSYALRLAGWPDDRPVWTGSCPCQPFSVAGKRKGFDDERHLWPVFRNLIAERRPPVVFGEQVASAAAWLAGVRSDLEAVGYTVGAVPIEAASVGAPHKRDRFWFVADASQVGRGPRERHLCSQAGEPDTGRRSEGGRPVAEPDSPGRASWNRDDHAARHGHPATAAGDAVGRELGDSGSTGLAVGSVAEVEPGDIWREGETAPAPGDRGGGVANADLVDSGAERPERGGQQRGARRDPWAGAEWLTGADGKARRVEPGIRLLAHGVPARVGRLRAYGNAISPPPAAEFISAYLDVREAA